MLVPGSVMGPSIGKERWPYTTAGRSKSLLGTRIAALLDIRNGTVLDGPRMSWARRRTGSLTGQSSLRLGQAYS